MTAMVRARGLAGYVPLMRELAVDPLPLLRRYRIPPDAIEDEDALLPVHAVVSLLEASATATGCADFGLRLSQKQDISILGPLAVAIQNSPTVADALQFASRHLFVQSPALVFTVIRDSSLVSGSVELRCEMVFPREPVQRQAFDLCLGD